MSLVTGNKCSSSTEFHATGRSAFSVLSFGYAQPELTVKHKALSEAGFTVTTLSEFGAVKELIAAEGYRFKLLIIGFKVPQQEREALAELFHRNKTGRNVIFFYRGSISNAEKATAVLSERGSPQNLLDAACAMHSRNGKAG